jgi:Fe2+ transport system protein FeoA
VPSEPIHSPPPAPHTPDDGSLPLTELKPGGRAVIEAVDVSTPIGRRLQDLGFVARTSVTMVRNAPLGDPVVYELRGTRLCLRRSEARLVQVRPE